MNGLTLYGQLIFDMFSISPIFYSEFGSKVMNMKLFLKSLAGLFEHSDKNVRAEVCVLCSVHVCSHVCVCVCV